MGSEQDWHRLERGLLEGFRLDVSRRLARGEADNPTTQMMVGAIRQLEQIIADEEKARA